MTKWISYMYTYILPSGASLPTHPIPLGHHRVLSWAPCAIHGFPLAIQFTHGSVGREDPLEKEMPTRSSTLAWRIPCTEEPGGLQSMGSHKSWTRLNNSTTTAAKCIYVSALLNASSRFPAVSTNLFSLSVPEHPLLMVHVISLNPNDSWSKHYAHIWECGGKEAVVEGHSAWLMWLG